MLFLTVLGLNILVNQINAQEMSSIGYAYHSFISCNLLYMDRLAGLPPLQENYWNGTFSLLPWPNITEVRLQITLDHPATVRVNPYFGRVRALSNRTFYIRSFEEPPRYPQVSFTVHGDVQGAFPNVEKIELNGVTVCDNPKKWEVTLLSFQDFAQAKNDKVEEAKCGKRLLPHHSYITNGYPSEEGDWPWHGAIYHVGRGTSRYVCGGSLINSQFILTAAHCLYENERKLIPTRVTVQLGKHDLRTLGKNAEEFPVQQIIVHNKYNTSNLDNDIALLQLASVVQYSNYIFPVCMWERDKREINYLYNQRGTVVGWGLTENKTKSTILTQAEMPIVSLSTCLISNRNFFGTYLSDTNYCAGFRNGTSVCNGDSGGGMFLKEDGLYRIRGIVSLSVNRGNQRICNSEEYVIFTDVAKYINWIDDKILDPLGE